MTIPVSTPVFAVLGGSLTLPCLVSLAHPPPSPPTNGRYAVLSLPRVKWTVLTHGRETEILVARGDRVRVSEAYKDRASLLNYAYSPADLTLRLESVRQNDTGFYRCEVQQGLEDADDVAQVKVKGEKGQNKKGNMRQTQQPESGTLCPTQTNEKQHLETQ